MQDSVERLQTLVKALVPGGTPCVVVKTTGHLHKTEDRGISAIILGARDTGLQYRVLVAGSDRKARVQVHRHDIIQPAAMRAMLNKQALPAVVQPGQLTSSVIPCFSASTIKLVGQDSRGIQPLPVVAPIPSSP